MPKQQLSINLDSVRTSAESRIFSGRPRGEWCRTHFKLDEQDEMGNVVIVTIPEYTYSVNMSFFLGLFGPSVVRYGKQQFYLQYKFVCDDIHYDTIHAGVDQALKESSVFEKKNIA